MDCRRGRGAAHRPKGERGRANRQPTGYGDEAIEDRVTLGPRRKLASFQPI
jgi:hypothetical protein